MSAKILNPRVLEEWASGWLNQITLDIFQQSQENLDELKVNYTGQLKKSGTSWENASNLHKEIRYNVIYAQDVEFGYDAGRDIDVEPLKKWVRIKLNRDEEFAYYVKHKLETEGFEGYFFLKSAMTVTKFRYEE